MARKLGKTTDQRMAMLKNLTTDLLVYGRIETTEARAKEVRSLAENLIALAIKEKDNFETVDQKVVKAKLDSKGNKAVSYTHLYQREDQKPEIVQNRLEIYKNTAEELIKYYEGKNVLRTEKAGNKAGRTSYDVAEKVQKDLE